MASPTNETMASQEPSTFKVVHFTLVETSATAGALALIMALTIVGNLMIFYVVLRNKRLWTEMNMFLLNLAFGDLAVGIISMVFPLITAIKREWIFGKSGGTICQLSACCNSVLFCSTIFTHTIISIDRYLVIVHPMKKIMTRKKAILMIMGVWIFSVVVVLGPVFGWGKMEYNSSTLQCGFGFPRDKTARMYIISVAAIAFIIPLIIMTYAYLRIYISVKKHTRRMSLTASGMQQQSMFQAQKRIVLTFFLALIAFFICWGPFFSFIAIAVVVKNSHQLPHGLGLASYVCGFVNSACNPFIVGLRNEQFKIAFSKMLCGSSCCEGSTGSEDSTKCLKPAKTTMSTRTASEEYEPYRNTKNIHTRNDESLLETHDETEELTLPKKHKVHMVRPRKRSSEDSFSGRPVAYKQFLHVKGETSWRESGV